MKSAVLVTGAGGFLATAVATAAPGDWRLLGLVRPGASAGSAGSNWHALYDSTESLVAAEPSVDVVLHLAARIPGDITQFDPELVASNIGLPGHLLVRYPEARHVLASSAAVYGTPDSLPLSVDSPVRPCTPYGWSKLAAENMMRTAGRHAILRFSSIVGHRMRTRTFIPVAVAAARSGRIILHGDGSRTQDYIDVRDAAAMCLQAAMRSDNFVALAVSGTAHSNKEVAETLAGITGAAIEYRGRDGSPSFAYTLSGATTLGPCRVPLRQTLLEMVGG